MAVAVGQGEYPDVFGILNRVTDKVYKLNGPDIAQQVGDIRAVNVALVGALSIHLDIPMELWRKVIESRVPPETLDINLKAFEMGRTLMKVP